MSIPSLSDTIKLDDVHAGDANAGNGGDGYNYGNIDYSPSAYVANTQKVTGSYVDVSNGDHVKDWASWDGGYAGDGGDAKAKGYKYVENYGSGGDGGSADSNGSLTSKSGGNVAAVHADTQAAQYTELMADQHGTILAGVGGNGGSGNMAKGGDISTALVHTNPSTTTTTTTTDTVLKCCEDHYSYDPHCDIDMSHIPV